MIDDASNYRESTIRARAWLTPEQFKQFIGIIATLDLQQPHLQLRDELLFQYMYDLGLRVSEVVKLKVDHLHLEADPPHVYLPSNVQKQPPGNNVKPPARMKFDLDDTLHKTQIWLNTRWDKDSEYLFPSQKGGRLLPTSVPPITIKYREEAGVNPYTLTGEKGPAEYISGHTFRHSVGYRMLVVEDGNDIYDLNKRLRHKKLSTTKDYYDHFLIR